MASGIGAELAIYPVNPAAHYQLALVYSDMGDREKALEHLRSGQTGEGPTIAAGPNCPAGRPVEYYILSMIASPNPEHDSSFTPSRPSRTIKRARS